MKKKGFTLVELLVVVAIIALLVAILAPALSRVKQQAERIVCGTNLRGLGNACMVYATSFEGEFPIQGQGYDVEHDWGWVTTKFQDGSLKDWNGTPGLVTVGASLYLLIREADVTPKQFVCPSGDEKAYDGENASNLDIVELWDFGMYLDTDTAVQGQGRRHGPKNHVSYSYQLPYDVTGPEDNLPAYPPDSSADASIAIMADKNPWFDPKLIYSSDYRQLDSETYTSSVAIINWQDPDSNPAYTGPPKWERWMVEVGNTEPHLRQGQEVLWGDSHVTFERRPDCGIKNDNIYTPYKNDAPPWNEWNIRQGYFSSLPPIVGGIDRPKIALDNFLVNDDEIPP